MKEIKIERNILRENSSLLQDFFKDINKYPILSADEQKELARKCRNGDELAREKLITCNLKFVVTCAKQYVGQGVALMDLIQCGIVGLIQSLKNYDPDRGYNFLSFAVWYIRREIIKEIYNTGRTIRYPITFITRITKVKKAYDKFVEENQREPTEEEIIKITNLSKKQYEKTLSNKSYCESLETPVTSDNKSTLADTIPYESDPDKIFVQDSINDCLRYLSAREKKVIIEYYGLNNIPAKTIKEIAEEMDLGEERIRQFRKSGIKKLSTRCNNILKTLL